MMHAVGYIHNDIRKENILVDGNENPLLIDFGFASRTNYVKEVAREKNQLLKCLGQF